MKKLLGPLVISFALLTGCATATQNVIHTANVVAAYERMEFQQDKIVSMLESNKGAFSEEEVELLAEKRLIVDQVRAEILMAKETGDNFLEAVQGGSNLVAQYGLVKSSVGVAIDILEHNMSEFPLTLQYRLKQQISDAKQLDASVEALLTSEDGINHAEALKSVAQLVGTISKLVVLL